MNARAEELPLDLGTFRTATFAQSFHWMDRERVAATVFEMLEPNGAWVHVDTKTHRGAASEEQLSHPQPPRREIEELVERYLGPAKRAGQGTLPGGTPSGEGEIMVAAGFAGPRRRVLDTSRVFERSEDEIVASVFSVSSSAQNRPLGETRRSTCRMSCSNSARREPNRCGEVSQTLQLIIWTRPADDSVARHSKPPPLGGKNRAPPGFLFTPITSETQMHSFECGPGDCLRVTSPRRLVRVPELEERARDGPNPTRIEMMHLCLACYRRE